MQVDKQTKEKDDLDDVVQGSKRGFHCVRPKIIARKKMLFSEGVHNAVLDPCLLILGYTL